MDWTGSEHTYRSLLCVPHSCVRVPPSPGEHRETCSGVWYPLTRIGLNQETIPRTRMTPSRESINTWRIKSIKSINQNVSLVVTLWSRFSSPQRKYVTVQVYKCFSISMCIYTTVLLYSSIYESLLYIKYCKDILLHWHISLCSMYNSIVTLLFVYIVS